MPRDRINWKVEELDLKEFISCLDIEIPIDKGQYNYIFNNVKIHDIKISTYTKEIEKLIIETLYKKSEYNSYKKQLYYSLSLSYIPDFKKGNYKIGYSPIEIFKNIFKILNISEELDYIDYSDNEKIKELKKKIEVLLKTKKLEELKKDNKDINKISFIEDSINNIDNIFLLSTYDIENKIKEGFIYKNLLYYLAVKSLDLIDETDDIKYGLLPKQYYIEVSSGGKAEYPNQLYMQRETYSYNYHNFNDRFNELLLRYPFLFEESLGIKEINVMNEIDIVKADNFIKEVQEDYFGYIRVYKKRIRKTKTDEELLDMLNKKIEFYKKLLGTKEFVSPIKGKNNLDGYYGFVLNNDYIILDKFFNKRRTDYKVKPSSDEAIYVMPIDLFVKFNGSKRKILEYIKKNPRGNVKRYYHTKKQSYQEKVLKTCEKENVSTMSNEWFINIFAPKKLVLEDK